MRGELFCHRPIFSSKLLVVNIISSYLTWKSHTNPYNKALFYHQSSKIKSMYAGEQTYIQGIYHVYVQSFQIIKRVTIKSMLPQI